MSYCPCVLKVRNLLTSRNSPKRAYSSSKKMKPTSEGPSFAGQIFMSKVRAKFIEDVYTGGVAGSESSSLDEDTVSRLMDVLSDTDVPWMKLAEKLGMKTLTQLYVDTKAPCQHLLQHYKVTPPAPHPLIT